jgi:hypothetical protein
MRNVGWLTGENYQITFPNFVEHNGSTAKKRAKTQQRVTKHRNARSVTDVTLKALPEKRREEKSNNTSSDEEVGRVTAPRRKSGYLLDEEFWAEMRRHYPDIEVEAESRKMDAWLLARPGRKKTRQFCVNWLNKAEPALAAAKPKERDLSWS